MRFLTILTAGALALAFSAGCGSSGGGSPDSGIPDSPTSDAPTHKDGGKDSGKDSGKDAKPPTDAKNDHAVKDAGMDGPCIFENYVNQLLKEPANSDPATNLGQNCVDTNDAAAFKQWF